MKLLYTIFCFAVPMVILSWVLPRRYALQAQIFITAAFIGYESPVSLAVLSFVSFGNYYLLHKSAFTNSLKIAISIIFLALLIITTKILFTINHLWLIPLGLSYYTFRNIHYTLEYFKGKVRGEGILYYLAYNFFLPVIVIGPINRYAEFIKDWNRRRFDAGYLSSGLQYVLYGVSKIVILGNYLFTFKSISFINSIGSKHAWLKTYLEALRFTFNAYFQFAGYSDVAVGIALLMGFRILENFNYPFLATNMRDFWGRYHMSLSGFCRDYIYTPIAAHYRKPLFGIIATMLIIALWHEVSLRYLLWGVIQAGGIYAASLFKRGPKSFVIVNVSRLCVIHFFALSCVVISHNSLQSAWDVYRKLLLIA
jgi:alginate O-acetyltransferase complex protein AlgI